MSSSTRGSACPVSDWVRGFARFRTLRDDERERGSVEAVVVSVVAIATLCWLYVMVALVVGEGIGRPRFGHTGTWFAVVALIPGIGLLLFLAFGAELRSAKVHRFVASALIGVTIAIALALVMSPDETCQPVEPERLDVRVNSCIRPPSVGAATLALVSAVSTGIAWLALGATHDGRADPLSRPPASLPVE
jgi:hypothetical protein